MLVLAEASEQARRFEASSAVRVIEVEPEVAAGDLELWWEAVARDAALRGAPRVHRLDALEGWWSAARATQLDQRAPVPELSSEAERLLVRL